MKKHLLTTLLCFGAMIACNKQVTAQTLIHYWHFNNLTWSDTLANASTVSTIAHPGIFGIDADYSIHDTSKAKILYALQPNVTSNWPYTATEGIGFTYFDTIAGTTVNAQMSAATGEALRTRNPSDSMELLFYIPTINYENIVLAYACERSGSGMLQQVYDFSIDSGVNFSTTGLSITSDSPSATFALISISLGSTTANNSSKLVFRVKFNGDNATSNGNNRFDNVTVTGDSIGGPVSKVIPLNISATTYNISPNPATSSFNINCSEVGDRNILIYNTLGQTVLTEAIYDKQTLINTVGFSNGTYYVSIHENATGKTTTLPFVKQ